MLWSAGEALYTIQSRMANVLFTKLNGLMLGNVAVVPWLRVRCGTLKSFFSSKESLKKGGSAFQPAKWPGIGWRKLVWAEGCSLYCVSPQAGQKIVLTCQPPVDVRRSAARGKRVKQSCFLSINRRLLRWPSQTAPLTTCQISIVQVSFRYSSHVNSIKQGLTWKRHTCWYLKQTRKHPLVSNFTPLKEGSFPRHCASHHGPFVSLLSIHLKVTHRGDTFDICPMD